ncbi:MULTISPECIES: anti-sigma F factor [Pelosinus]|uniref:Anti-sigma F factor n=1 Tax=Pelosinus fermentans B4 TaxID=1149862 RepID=I9LDE4_9FIRM|nr:MULTISPECIES: anti-sigma F factor [Pelosinus]EIW18459.1 anti-sigma F factor [Pelosinus fermentans B4]EIW24473.1 anti-sigma regulatory factor, serine/threonine protein kinase [Pelosinus fermentans A11]OAM94469.1 anti-sigma regulatory factor, serine/threonine protein kinase [Pelosinus fermentans DSM 17108]SDR09927.1 stage II sporulation protein AB (anti-sigma F factor) [Pelosinus fermentans]
MAIKNQITMSIRSLSENVGIARVSTAAFAAQVDFTLNEIEEIKVAVSEAVSNAVIHGYEYQDGEIEIKMTLYEDQLEYIIVDHGKGIADIALARQPSYSSDPERMGLGFAFMESFMDELYIESEVNKGTLVRMVKKTLLKTEH